MVPSARGLTTYGERPSSSVIGGRGPSGGDMTDKLMIRASSVWLHLLCLGSVHTEQDEVRLNVGSAPASAGTAAHKCSEGLAKSGSIDWDTLTDVARRYNVDEDELRALCGMATALWRDVAESFPNALTEQFIKVELSRIIITGHVDLISIGGSVGRVGDWKFGYKDHWVKPQLQTYASLLLVDNPELTQATGTALWVRAHEAENYTMGRQGAREWLEYLERKFVDWDGVYHVGDHCQWCPRSHCCPAGRALARRDVECFVEESNADSLELMKPDELIATLQMARRVSRYAAACVKAIKDHVQLNGPVLGSERELTIIEEPRRSLDPLAAFPVLREDLGFKDEDLAASMKLRLGIIEQIVAKRAGRGKGAAAKRDLQARLEKAGAVTTNHIEELTTRRL